ncbi:MAG: DUF1501 domain-containing protein [Planctomycetes bacterium]|nr:DUF1501 domain-containing protein [Planctomycetota bacterium]
MNIINPNRREILRIGALGVGGLTLARTLELLETAPLLSNKKPATRAILIWLDGGASHIDTFDPKPNAPEEIRGNWKSIPTPLPNIQFGEGLSRLAAELPNFALIRSINSDAGEHEIARHLMLTGYPLTPALEYPSFGSAASVFGQYAAFPPYVAISQIPEHAKQLGSGFLPAENAPFLIDSNPSRPEYGVRDLFAPAGLDAARVDRRKALLDELDTFAKKYETNAAVRARTAAFERAWRLIASKEARDAFDLTKEDSKLRARYGDHALGQSCILARRLAEAGARFITIMDSGWDHHGRVHEELSRHRLPKLDEAVSTLFDDLRKRGLWDDTLIIIMGDFGRTPKLNNANGRDHWPRANCCILAGGAVKGGTIVGATDERAEQVVERPVSPADLAATIYTILGIDPDAELRTPDGRPVKLVNNGTAVKEVLA